MTTIDLIILGMLEKEPLSAYDIQKLVEYRKISQWVKISTPSIYKKVLQLESKGYVAGTPVKEGNFAEKVVYSLTNLGNKEFKNLMYEISLKPLHMFLDYNAVIVNLMSLSDEQRQTCLENMEANIQSAKMELEENIDRKENLPEIPELGMAVLHQQYALAEALALWIRNLKEKC